MLLIGKDGANIDGPLMLLIDKDAAISENIDGPMMLLSEKNGAMSKNIDGPLMLLFGVDKMPTIVKD